MLWSGITFVENSAFNTLWVAHLVIFYANIGIFCYGEVSSAGGSMEQKSNYVPKWRCVTGKQRAVPNCIRGQGMVSCWYHQHIISRISYVFYNFEHLFHWTLIMVIYTGCQRNTLRSREFMEMLNNNKFKFHSPMGCTDPIRLKVWLLSAHLGKPNVATYACTHNSELVADIYVMLDVIFILHASNQIYSSEW